MSWGGSRDFTPFLPKKTSPHSMSNRTPCPRCHAGQLPRYHIPHNPTCHAHPRTIRPTLPLKMSFPSTHKMKHPRPLNERLQKRKDAKRSRPPIRPKVGYVGHWGGVRRASVPCAFRGSFAFICVHMHMCHGVRVGVFSSYVVINKQYNIHARVSQPIGSTRTPKKQVARKSFFKSKARKSFFSYMSCGLAVFCLRSCNNYLPLSHL